MKVNLVVDVSASDALIERALAAFEGLGARTVLLEAAVPELPVPCEMCVVVAGTSVLVGDVAKASRALGCPAAVLIEVGQTWFAEAPGGAGAVGGAAAVTPVPVDDICTSIAELNAWAARKVPACMPEREPLNLKPVLDVAAVLLPEIALGLLLRRPPKTVAKGAAKSVAKKAAKVAAVSFAKGALK